MMSSLYYCIFSPQNYCLKSDYRNVVFYISCTCLRIYCIISDMILKVNIYKHHFLSILNGYLFINVKYLLTDNFFLVSEWFACYYGYVNFFSEMFFHFLFINWQHCSFYFSIHLAELNNHRKELLKVDTNNYDCETQTYFNRYVTWKTKIIS